MNTEKTQTETRIDRLVRLNVIGMWCIFAGNGAMLRFARRTRREAIAAFDTADWRRSKRRHGVSVRRIDLNSEIASWV